MASQRTRTRMSGRIASTVALLGLAVLLILMTGCESEGENLNKWLRKAKATKGAKIDPLPEPTVYQPVPYIPAEERTPFEPVALVAPEIKPVESEISPDFSRDRETLETFALSELALVGMVDREGGMVALVQAPNGEVVRVQQGNYMGRNFGRIESLDSNGVELREIVKDDTGRWQKRSTVFGFAEAGGG